MPSLLPFPLPLTISIRFCTVCKRTDRFNNLPDRHFHKGTSCDGEIQVAVYRFDRVQPPPKMEPPRESSVIGGRRAAA